MTTTRTGVASAPLSERAARRAEALLRLAGDARVGAGLLALVAVANVVAALLPDGAARLDGWPYAVLLAATALSGIAAVGVRSPAAWREWRSPGATVVGPGALHAALPPASAEDAAARLRALGYRVRVDASRPRWAVHGVRHGASRFAGLASHLAIVAIVLGVATGAAFGSETVFSLLPGEQALLDEPRDGFSAALRLDRFDAGFAEDGRPLRLDSHITFLESGAPVRSDVLRVNEPGDFAGYLVHPWTYGPAVRLRVTSLGGDVLLDAPVPLDGERDGVPFGAVDLPTRGIALGTALADAAANEVVVDVIGAGGLVDAARLRPGERARLGDVIVELGGFDAWVTFASRSDPGIALVFGGGAALSASVAVAFWLPRRRVTVRPATGSAEELDVIVRGERFEAPARELDRLRRAFGAERS